MNGSYEKSIFYKICCILRLYLYDHIRCLNGLNRFSVTESYSNVYRFLAVINTDLVTNINLEAVLSTYSDEYKIYFNELIDADLMKKQKEEQGVYRFTFQHIKEALCSENRESHRNANKGNWFELQ